MATEVISRGNKEKPENVQHVTFLQWGQGTPDDGHAILLTPVPEPSTLSLLFAGMFLTIKSKHRRK